MSASEMSAAPPIQVTRASGVVTVTLNRPEKKNAVSRPMWTELADIFTAVERNVGDRVLVITGAAGNFCSGADITAAPPENGAPQHQLTGMRRVNDAAIALHRLTKPSIAKVDGVAVGAGLNLALGCDLVVASDRARLSEIFVRRGLSVDFGGSWLLPRIVGLQTAKRLAFLGDIISADEARRFGMVTEVVPADELDAFVDDWAARLAAGPPIALSLTKRLLDDSFAVSMEQALENEGRAQAVNQATRDTAEAAAAFVEKRDPSFTGESGLGT